MDSEQEEVLARKFSEPFQRIDAGLVPMNEGSYQTARDARQDLEAMMADPRFTSAVIARAITIATERVGTAHLSYRMNSVAPYLQRKLTAEHVAAQERMTAAAGGLERAALKVAKASYWMAFASFIVTAAALYVAVVK